tara:strand:+ start:9799 stop:10104 length:306 start_codon:yes stop_codon:yes gene_type:complete
MKYVFYLIFSLTSIGLFSQNERDVAIHEVIYPSLCLNYELAKSEILKLEETYGHETNLKYFLLDRSFENNDIDFFKPELAILVRNHGFILDYEPGVKSHFD